MGITKGKKLGLFVKKQDKYVSIAFATNHTFSSSASTINISHKDLEDTESGTAKWEDQEIDTMTWTITSENLYANTGNGITAADIIGYYTAGTVLDVKFGVCETNTGGAPATGWEVSETILSGKAIITQLDINAPVDDNATFSITLTGKGKVSVE